MPGRNFTGAESYSWGYNGKRKDNEIAGVDGAHYDFGARIYDSRVGRWYSLDPLMHKYPGLSDYMFTKDNPILFIDKDGLDWLLYTGSKIAYYGGDPGDKSTLIKLFDASSGKPPWQRSSATSVPNLGPVPEGEYLINLKLDPTRKADLNSEGGTKPGEGIELIPWDNKGNPSLAAWGQWRARLEPTKGTDTKGRSNFYLHDSYKGFSSGCIETESCLYYNLVGYRAEGNNEIEVRVDYQGGSRTKGNTDKDPPPWKSGETISLEGKRYPYADPDSFPDSDKMPESSQDSGNQNSGSGDSQGNSDDVDQ